MTGPVRVCKDCVGVGGPRRPRPAPFPGPRCATHHRLARTLARARNAATQVARRFGLEPEDYARLYEHQGRRCAICRRATGATKRLAVDHDHKCCPGPTSCGQCVRGLLCGPCNSMLSHARDDPELFRRAIRYLREWPALAI